MPDDIEEMIDQLLDKLVEADQANDVTTIGTIAGQLADLLEEADE